MKAGLLKATDRRILQSDAYAVPEGGSAIVYLTSPDPSGELLACGTNRLPASRVSTL